MAFLFVQLSIIISTAFLFLAINGVNEWMIQGLRFIPGMNWVSLPAGICVLATLLLGPIGTVGILIAHLLLDFPRFEFVDLPYALLGAVAHSAGPYLVYLFADRVYGLQASLSNLTSKRLLLVILICSAICPALQSLGMSAFGATWDMLIHYLLMFAGNLVGALVFTYLLKAISATLP
jgi:hypothetical protein